MSSIRTSAGLSGEALFGWSVAVVAAAGGAAGSVFGLVRGWRHPSTLWAAAVEGCVLFAVPAGVLGIVLGAAAVTVRALARRRGSRARRP